MLVGLVGPSARSAFSSISAHHHHHHHHLRLVVLHPQINAWFIANRNPHTGKYPDLPPPEAGGSKPILNPPLPTVQQLLDANAAAVAAAAAARKGAAKGSGKGSAAAAAAAPAPAGGASMGGRSTTGAGRPGSSSTAAGSAVSTAASGKRKGGCMCGVGVTAASCPRQPECSGMQASLCACTCC